MHLRNILLTTALALVPLAAQQTPALTIAPSESPLRTYLTLTESQITSLQQIQERKRTAESAIYTQMSERQRQLDALLRDGSNDVATIGRLMVEINNLRKQLPLPSDQYRASALAVLTDAQKAKLPALTEALKVMQPANEAVFYNLVDSPNQIAIPRPLPMPVFLPSATVDSEP